MMIALYLNISHYHPNMCPLYPNIIPNHGLYYLAIYPISHKEMGSQRNPGLAHGDSLQSSRCVNKSYPYATGQV